MSAHIEPFEISRRSPDLSLCDYALWQEINWRMRQQELTWPKTKREARQDYLLRLKRTALRLSKSFLEKSVGDMRRRCQLLYKAKGYHFEEGHWLGGARSAVCLPALVADQQRCCHCPVRLMGGRHAPPLAML